MKYFYSHLVSVDEALLRLDQLELNDEQKKHLATLLDSTIHYTILDAVLSKLTEEDKKEFLIKLAVEENNQVLMDFLKGKVNNIEEEIVIVVTQFKDEFHQDIEEAKCLI